MITRRTRTIIRRFASFQAASLQEDIHHHPFHLPHEFSPSISNDGREDELLHTARSHILSGETNSVQIVRLKDVRDSVDLWRERLPRVTPFYAVKCNPDHEILSLLKSMNTGFDAASEPEIQAALNTGIDPSRVIYANPIKQISHLQGAAKRGVMTTTFTFISIIIIIIL